MRSAVLGLAVMLPLVAVAGPAVASHDEAAHTDNMRVVDRAPFPYGTDLAFSGNTMVAGSGDWDGAYPTGARLFNVANPQNAKRMSFAQCDGWHADVDFAGSRYVVQSHDSAGSNSGCSPGEGEEGVRVIDVSNKNDPKSVGFAKTVHGSHNLTAVGDTGLVYVSSYNLSDPSDVDGVSIVDVGANPQDPPVRFLEFPDADNSAQHPDMKNESGRVPTSPGCHDVGIDPQRDLAFCAGIDETMIWDISDPRNPVIISIIRNPAINIHHGARPNADGDVLIIGDEWAGAAGGPTACMAPNAPAGALWFYDISDPRNPQVKNYWSPPKTERTADFCTSHFFDAFGDRDWVVTSWYQNGVYVVDFSDPSNPKMVASYDPPGATFWSAYAHRGAIYANSFAPATLNGHDSSTKKSGGLWVFELDGYSRSDG